VALKTLFIGLVFAMGMFALKSGVGIHYLLTRKQGKVTKVISFILFALTYLLLFLVSSLILQRVDLMTHFATVQKFLQSGMLVHIIMAAGLAAWGIILLKRKEQISAHASYGWLALIVPCPICLTVIFLSVAFIVAYFPDAGHLAVIWAYIVFMGIALFTVLGMTLWGIKSSSTPEADMGAAMLIIAVYFFLSVIIMPQFGEMDSIYRIAAYKGEKQTIKIGELSWLYVIMAALFAAGFLKMIIKSKRKFKWL
jgi:predicted transporter